jgi:AraC-like DNA-binding protein
LRVDRPAEPAIRILGTAAMDRIASLCREVHSLASDVVRHSAGAAWLLTSAWAAFENARERQAVRPSHPAIAAAARHIRQADTAQSLESLAGLIGLSPSHLSRLFRQQTGLSIVAYRHRIQLERFFAILQNQPHLTVLAAALQAGFGSYAQFHRVFRKQFGCGPREYLNQ